VFWGTPKEPLVDNDPNDELVVGTARSARGMYVGASSLVVVSIVIALFAGPLSGITARAGEDLHGRETYRSAVLDPVAGASEEDAGDTGDTGDAAGDTGTALADPAGDGPEVTP